LRPLAFFYLLVLYVLLQFSWWAYLLIELNSEVYEQRLEIIQRNGLPEDAHFLKEKLQERWLMVAGEGVVFLAILIFGIYKTREAFRKEFALARQQRNFLLSVTHEFKSPLAAVKLNLQTLLRRELPREQQNMMLNRAVSEADRINNLIENALLAARIDSKSYNFHKEEFNVSETLDSIVKSRVIPGETSRNYITRIEPEVYLYGDPFAFASLFLNLIENAEKYSPDHTDITIELHSDRNHVIFSVADLGSGVPESEKSRIFNKFYRVGNEDTRKTKGTGLGLFIVKHIVNYHSGEIKVLDNHPSGAIFRVTLPKKPGSA
jgi:two-component system, OmpR family, phosphate regulon sensor histidine kinase PhoR